MLAEYALVPDIFDVTAYSSSEICGIHLQYLKEALLEEALVRDLRGGEWRDYIKAWMQTSLDHCHPKAKELLKKLATQKRIHTVPFCGSAQPANHADWCVEAIASHNWKPLNGVITSTAVAAAHKKIPLVASIEKLSSAPWWQKRGHSVRLRKQTQDYLQHLQLVLSHANSIAFIDPYLDPTQPHYREFYQLIEAANRADIAPLIEIHTAAKGFDKDNNSRKELSLLDWKVRLRRLSHTLQNTQLEAEIFVWDYFHDRYIISNIVGINLNGGIDISPNPQEETTWNRLTRDVRDDIQREFTPNASQHKLKYQFRLP